MARRMIWCVGAAALIVSVLLLSLTPVLSAPPSATQPEAATFNIFGHVVTPGRYAWSAGITVKQAVALAGGYDSRGSKSELQIQRMVDGKLTSRVVDEDARVQPDDVIMVRASRYEQPVVQVPRRTGPR